jgi:tetraacyldisaccharide 4'-kinase
VVPFPAAWRRRISSSLEAGAWRSPFATKLAELWAMGANPVRAVDLPPTGRIVAIGGATLGGSYKTPVALALARALVSRCPVAVVATAYSARVTSPLIVTHDMPAGFVGDEAALFARELGSLGVPVAVARRRSEAIWTVATEGTLVVVDGLLQTRPRRAYRSLLVLDAEAPWGSGHCPPVGDLRARRDRLLGAADAVVVVGPQATPPELGVIELPIFRIPTEVRGARTPDGALLDPGRLREARLGLWLAIARPERILRALDALGIRPLVVRLWPDHAAPPSADVPRAPFVDAWLTSAKCATKLGPRFGGAPVWVIDHRLGIDRALVDFLAGRRAPLDCTASA